MNIQQIMQGKVNGATFVTLDTDTVFTKMRKTIDTPDGRVPNPQYGRVTTKVTGLNVMVFQNKTTNGYENMVNKRLKAEGFEPGSFELSPRVWGQRLPNEPIIEHKGNFYLEVIVLKAGNVQHYLDDQPIDMQDIEGLSVKKEPTQGGLENKVIVRDFKFESIKAITVNGTRYESLQVDEFYTKLDESTEI